MMETKTNMIEDERLKNVNGGWGDNEDAPLNGKCPYCSESLKKVGNHFECPCGARFDKNGNEINTYDTKSYR